MGHEFHLAKQIEVEATPDEVWEAIATGPGIDAWFMGRTELEGRDGGTVGLTLGGRTMTSRVTAWEPGRRFAHQGRQGDFFTAIEYLVEARDGGSSTLRLVQSGVLGDDWETEYEAMRAGWDMYLHTLAQYLTHFRGRPATVVSAFRPGVPAREHVWPAILAELGVEGPVTEGTPVRVAVGDTPVDGIVDYAALPEILGLRTAGGLFRFIHSGPARGSVMVIGHHLFDAADPDKSELAWRTWLDRVVA
ncbi:SRPBCC family protein [Sphaerisporangium aureirubrum]|uniref:SRPBCC domain-containing protein n=1 Tax=Sphaerisporangium aureirubrum TaxID=1544736 RepID=A0ABW1NXW4_9ACTN